MMSSRKPLFGVREAVLSLWIAAGLAGLGGSTANAAPVPLPANATLQTLIGLNASGGIQIGNFVFSDFSFTPTTFSASNPAPSASQIAIGSAPGPDVGLTFNSFWQSVPGGNQDGVIRYAVQVTTGSIDQVNLAFNGAAPLPSTGTVASVTETVSTLLTDNNVPTGPGTAIGQLTTINSSSGGTTTTNNANLILPLRQAGLFVSKDIAVASGPNGIATISFVDNTYRFSALAPQVPEPAALGLLGAMGLGLLARRRRA